MRYRTRSRRSFRPGLPPGTIDEPAPEERVPIGVSIVDYSTDTIDVRDGVPVEEIGPAPSGHHRWIRVQGTPTAGLLQKLGSEFGIHGLVLEDINNRGQRIKAEDYDNLMFTVLRPPLGGATDEGMDVDLSLILTDHTLITVYETEDEDFFAPVFGRLRNPESLLRHRKIDFLYQAIVDLVVDRCFPILHELEDEADRLETAILKSPDREYLRGVHILRRRSQRLRGNLWATRDALSRIERSTNRFIGRETIIYFRDIEDHVVHLLDTTSALRDTANGLMELYMSGVSNRMNEVVKVLTIISTVFIPITFIAGVYGMNFAHMPELSLRWAYPAVLGVMGLIAGGMLVYFRRRRWL